MAPVSADAPAPRMGPGFLPLNAWPYRAEMALATVVLFAALFGWRLVLLGDLDLLGTIVWFLWPDLAAFVPIGLAMRGGRAWPAWGAVLYDVLHSFLAWAGVFAVAWAWTGMVPWPLLAWAGVFAVAWAWTGMVPWPLLAWAGHITMDRSVGYYLRAPPSSGPSRLPPGPGAKG